MLLITYKCLKKKTSGLLCGHECGTDHNNVEIVFPLSVNGNIMNEITDFIYALTQLIKHFSCTYIWNHGFSASGGWRGWEGHQKLSPIHKLNSLG